MGQKGDQHMNEAQLSAEVFIDKISSIDGITSKKMFGGYGIFQDGTMFGIINSSGQIFLKSNEKTAIDFLNAGGEKHGKMPYYSVPKNILEDLDQLLDWTNIAIGVSK